VVKKYPEWRELLSFLKNKTVLITGGVGTVGKELIRQVIKQEPKEIRVIDINESGIFFLEEEFGEAYRAYALGENPTATRFHANIGDIRDLDKLISKMKGVDVVLHAAALKHVILCERSPFDAVQTNILGVKNIIKAAQINGVERVIFTSSDKAVNPTSVMGTSKLMGERLFTAANSNKLSGDTIFSSTRFGNVIGSRGSVVPIFYRQIKAGGPITITDKRMTRFIMTIEESVKLVLEAAELAKGGEVFVTKMPVMRIEDLAIVMKELLAPKFGYDPSAIEFNEIGSKAGEKLYEELMSDEETSRTVELEQMFSVLPAFRGVYEDVEYSYPEIKNETVSVPYASGNVEPMSQTDIRAYLEQHRILEEIEETGGI
jgi:FlaA1/EpsC-like NDP-sugar epimerase